MNACSKLTVLYTQLLMSALTLTEYMSALYAKLCSYSACLMANFDKNVLSLHSSSTASLLLKKEL